MPKVESLTGPTTQYVRGNNYSFERNAAGRFVATIHDADALACFKDHPAYRILGEDLASSTSAITVAGMTNPAPAARTKKDAAAEAKALGVAITQRMSLAEIDAAIAEHQAKVTAEILAAQSTEPVPDVNAPDLNAEPDSAQPEGESDGTGNSAASAAAAISESAPEPVIPDDPAPQPDPDVSDDD